MGKTWLITGCRPGNLGYAIAETALAAGGRVAAGARSPERIEELKKKAPDRVMTLRLDVTDPDGIQETVHQVEEAFGGIDVLVNAAGYSYRCAVEEGEKEEVAELFATDFFGPVDLIKACLPGMRERKRGAVVSITSLSAVCAPLGSPYYAAVKAAFDALSDALAKELSPLGIDVLIAEPGGLRTGFHVPGALKGSRLRIPGYEAGWRVRPENQKEAGNEPGDPGKTAELIVRLLEDPDHPKRMLFGSDAVDTARKEYETRLSDLKKWEEMSRSIDISGNEPEE